MGLKSEINKQYNNNKLPPITIKLSGLTKIKTRNTDKELLLIALEKKFLHEKR